MLVLKQLIKPHCSHLMVRFLLSFLFVVKGPLLASDVGETNQHFDTTWKFITIKIPADQHKIENFMQYLLW